MSVPILKIKWFFRPAVVIVAILFAGPFALPLLWRSPAFKKTHKIFITALVAILTIWLIKASVELYNILLERMQELQEILR